MLAGASPDNELGNDDMSWAYDGHYEEKAHSGVCDSYGKRWQVGDVIGVFLDIQDRTISEFVFLLLPPPLSTRVTDFSWSKHTKTGKIYIYQIISNGHKYKKCP
jgi:hypothetical protein